MTPRRMGARSRNRLRRSVLGLIAGATVGCGTAPRSSPSDATDASDVSDSRSGSATTEYAPYFYTWGWGSPSYAFASLAEMKSKGGPAAVTLAFVLSSGGRNTTTDIQAHRDDVQAFVAAGGHVKASFGGATHDLRRRELIALTGDP